MSATPWAILQCTDPACNLRVPATGGQRMDRCPRCHAPATIAALGVAEEKSGGASAGEPLPVELVVDNVRSAFNVGSLFRSADGAGIAAIHLCGLTPTPANPRVAKTALGAEHAVTWRETPNALYLVEEWQRAGAAIWALESTPAATSLWETPLPPSISHERPLLLVAGNEVTGVDPAILRIADAVVEIPMRGRKNSFNVAIAVGVALTLLGTRIEGSHANP